MKSHTRTVFVGAKNEESAADAPPTSWFHSLDHLRDVASGYRTRFKFFELTMRTTVTGVRRVGGRRKATP